MTELGLCIQTLFQNFPLFNCSLLFKLQANNLVHSEKIHFVESVLIVKDLGVQFTTSGVLGLETSQFIEQHKIIDVLINEVITMVSILINDEVLNQMGKKAIKSNYFNVTITSERREG